MAVARQKTKNFKGANLNVEMFGAKGDGVTDDWRAIRSAVAAVKKNGGRLAFPRGQYRIAYDAADATRTSATGAIDLSPWDNSGTWVPCENIEIHFAHGAVLLMDNLAPDGFTAQTHGVFAQCRWLNVGGDHTPLAWTGYAISYGNIKLTNVRVRWATKGSARASGDSFRFTGTKSESTAPYGITLENCSAENAPQVGCIFMGCKEVHVQNFRANDNWADTCHFNACFEGCTVDGVKAKDCGDDTLAVVTYYPDAITLASGVDIDTEVGPFTSPDQTTANNNGLEAVNIQKIGGGANCVRLQGANRVSVSNVYADAAGDAIGAAVWVGSVLANGTTLGQTSMACTGCQVSHVVGKGCQVGEMVVALGFLGSEDDTWLRNEVSFRDIRSTAATQYSFLAQATRGFRVDGAEMDTEKAFFIDSSNFRIDNWNQSGSNVEIYGVNSNYYDTHDIDTAPWHNIKIGHVYVDGGLFLIRNARGVSIDGEVFVQNAPEEAIQFERVTDTRASALRAINPNRNNSGSIRAIRFLAARRFSVTRAEVNQDTTQLEGAWEFGGGDAYNISTDIRASLIHRTAIADSASRIVVQGSTYAPTDLYYTARYRNASGSWTRVNQDDLPLPTTGLSDLVAYGTNLGAAVSPTNPVGSWLLERSASAGGSYLVGIGGNVRFDGTNWVTASDGGSNGGILIAANYGDGNVQIFCFPSTGASPQTISPISLLSYRRAVIDTSGDLTLTGMGTSRTVKVSSGKLQVGGKINLTSSDDIDVSGLTNGAIVTRNGTALGSLGALAADRLVKTDGAGAIDVLSAITPNLPLISASDGLPIATSYGSLYASLKPSIAADFPDLTYLGLNYYTQTDVDLLIAGLQSQIDAKVDDTVYSSHSHTIADHTHGGVTAGGDSTAAGGAGGTSGP